MAAVSVRGCWNERMDAFRMTDRVKALHFSENGCGDVTIEQLTYFLEAAETLNFSRAAENLYIHNTTICRGISNLEKELGAQLFLRGKNGLTLTKLGETLKSEGSLLIQHYGEVMERIEHEAKETEGHLRIIGPSAYTGLLDEPYRCLKEQYPNISYSIRDCDSGAFDAPYFSVKTGKADFGITYSTYISKGEPELMVKKLADERLDLLIPQTHPMYGVPKLAIGELRNTKILVASFMGENFCNAVYKMAGGKEGITVSLAEMPNDNPILLASAGFGVSFIPHTLARIGEVLNVLNPSASQPSHAEITDLDTSFDVVLIWKKNPSNPAVSLFLRILD